MFSIIEDKEIIEGEHRRDRRDRLITSMAS